MTRCKRMEPTRIQLRSGPTIAFCENCMCLLETTKSGSFRHTKSHVRFTSEGVRLDEKG